jgi:hypothetical protein
VRCVSDIHPWAVFVRVESVAGLPLRSIMTAPMFFGCLAGTCSRLPNTTGSSLLAESLPAC